MTFLLSLTLDNKRLCITLSALGGSAKYWEIVFMWARVFRYIILISFRFCTTPLLHGTSQTINKLHTNKATMKTINVKIFYLFISIIQFFKQISKNFRKNRKPFNL